MYYVEIAARKKSSGSTIYRVSLIVAAVAVASAPFVSKPLFPSLQHFVAVTVSGAWDSFSGWLTPPYLFFLLNCIILAIFANSGGFPARNQSHDHEPQELDHHRPFSEFVQEISGCREDSAPESENETIQNDCEEAEVMESGYTTRLLEVEKGTNSLEAPAWRPAVGIAIADDQSNKMLASARFTRRKVNVHESACKSLRVSQKHEETFESVWKKVTEGRHPPLTRHPRPSPNNPDESRNDHSSFSVRRGNEEGSPALLCSGVRRPGGSLKRESSHVGVDELNKRVEAFIEKFNTELRLQREDSLVRYMEMINRGAS